MQKKTIRIASRASKLALIQTEYIRKELLNKNPELEISIVKVTTKGDRDKSEFLYKAGAIGFFTAEIEKYLLDDKADIAVHSLKDLPTASSKGLIIAAIPKRQSPAEAIVCSKPITGVPDLPTGATVGTSSPRRIAQLKHIRNDLNCVPLRGNVETRVNKVLSGQIDAAILACAGLGRLGLAQKISAILPVTEFLPAPGQGALAVQIRENDDELNRIVSQLNDSQTRIAVETERQILAAMQGGCSIPLGVLAQIDGGLLTVNAVISDLEGKKFIMLSKTGPVIEAEKLAKVVVDELFRNGAKEILEQIKSEK